MKTSKFFFCVVCFLITNRLQAHLPEIHVSFIKNIAFVKTTAGDVSIKHLPIEQSQSLARFYAGPKQKSSLFSKPFKLSFKLSRHLLLNVSYN